MIMTGQTINAAEALSSGLVAKVVPGEDLGKLFYSSHNRHDMRKMRKVSSFIMHIIFR